MVDFFFFFWPDGWVRRLCKPSSRAGIRRLKVLSRSGCLSVGGSTGLALAVLTFQRNVFKTTKASPVGAA